jgi:hypothetical protein
MMSDALRALATVAFFALFAEVAVCGTWANLHRRRVPEGAWHAAGVDRFFWGFLGVNLYVPFSDLYYLLRIRGRLDQAMKELANPSSAGLVR